MTTSIGTVDPVLDFIFKRGEDFLLTLESETDVFPEETTARMIIQTSATDPTPLFTFDAAVTPRRIALRVESEVADTIPRNKPVRCFIRYPGSPTGDFRWAKGKTVRDD